MESHHLYLNLHQNCVFLAVHVCMCVHSHAHSCKIDTLHPSNITRSKCQLHRLNRSWHSSVSIVTGLCAGQSGVTLLAVPRNLSSLKLQTSSGVHSASCSMGTSTSAPPLYAFTVCTERQLYLILWFEQSSLLNPSWLGE
jgi:hypothetical protein